MFHDLSRPEFRLLTVAPAADERRPGSSPGCYDPDGIKPIAGGGGSRYDRVGAGLIECRHYFFCFRLVVELDDDCR